jgi:hypothetical protein
VDGVKKYWNIPNTSASGRANVQNNGYYEIVTLWMISQTLVVEQKSTGIKFLPFFAAILLHLTKVQKSFPIKLCSSSFSVEQCTVC